MLKKIASFLTAVFVFFASAGIPCINAEGGLSLTIETFEIDFGDVPQDRAVQVRVSMNDNPGINGVVFNMQADRRLGMDEMRFVGHEIDEVVTWGGCIYNKDENIASIYAVFDSDSWYYGNGNFITLRFYLPEDYRAGDFYPINFTEGYEYEEPRYNAEDGPHYKNESFGALNSGGIRIIGSTPAPEIPATPQTEPPAAEPAPQAPPQPEQPQASPEQQETQPQETSDVTETETETSSETVTTETVSVTELSSSSETSQTAYETSASVSDTETETAVTTEAPFTDTDDEIKEENKEGIPVSIIILTVLAVIIIPIVLIIIKRGNSNEQ